MLQSRWGRRLAALYLLVVAFAGGYLSYHVLFSHRSTEVLGILLIVMGMPWSSLLGRVVGPEARSTVVLIMALGILINLVLVYGVGAGLEYFRSKAES